MYEEHYGFVERPFNLTPDPRFLFKSESHGGALDLLQYALRRREGFVVVTGDIGTGKSTLCRAVLDGLDRRIFAAYILNPFLSPEDLLKAILQEFGLLSRAELREGRLSKQELVQTLHEFLLSLVPLDAHAVVIVDEAQNLSPAVLEELRILSNLETPREKLLQIVLVGQLELEARLKDDGLRQFDQRVSIRSRLVPLRRAEVAAYVEHRLRTAGPASSIAFSPRALDLVHRFSGGIPRLVNLVCDRSLMAACSARAERVEPDHVRTAAESLELRQGWTRVLPARVGWRTAAASLAVAGLLGITGAVAYQQARGSSQLEAAPARIVTQDEGRIARGESTGELSAQAAPPEVESASSADRSVVRRAVEGDMRAAAPAAVQPPPAGRSEGYLLLVGSFRTAGRAAEVRESLSGRGFPVHDPGAGTRSQWHRVYVGPYATEGEARQAEGRVRESGEFGPAQLVRMEGGTLR